MQLGDILIKKGLASPDQIGQAIERQKSEGGRLGDNLVAAGVLTKSQLSSVLNEPPKAPKTVEETRIPEIELRNLLLKAMKVAGLNTVSRLTDFLKLPSKIVQTIVDDCTKLKLLEPLGAASDGSAWAECRYQLTSAGKQNAAEALEVNLYVGPTPICLEEYSYQIEIQKIANERINREQLTASFDNLAITREFVDNVGPAINAGRSILLYGPPGNGKTTVAVRMSQTFTNVIYIPYAVYIDGQIMKLFDPTVHFIVEDENVDGGSIRRDDKDRRWVSCERPVVTTGGELTLEMLDLKFDPQTRLYEAPLHVKALNGTFIIDDFGRQIVRPEELLNRWIVPLESRIDFLKFHTGKSVEIPFDELIIFSTNMEPSDLMDPAFLRRIPFKLEVDCPSVELFKNIFSGVAVESGFEVEDETFEYILNELLTLGNNNLACYQPKFIIDQVVSACKYEEIPPILRKDLIDRAIRNLFADTKKKSPQPDVKAQQEDLTRAMQTLPKIAAGQ